MIKTQRIMTDSELDQAINRVNELVDLGFGNLTSDQSHLLNLLTDQIEAYERDRYHEDPISQARMLHSLLDNRRMTPGELAAETAIDEASISDILAGNRSLNDFEKTTVARVFCLGPEVFD